MISPTIILKRSVKSAAGVARRGYGVLPGRSSVKIFAYHRVVADIAKAEREAIYGIVISTATFRKHCEMLQSSYDVVSLETAAEILAEKRKPTRPTAVITFDDGYRDFYDEAFPVLKEFGLPATVFLPTAFIGQPKPLAHDRIFWLLKLALDASISIKNLLSHTGLAVEITNSKQLLKMTEEIVYLQHDVREKIITELELALGNKFTGYPREYDLLNWEMVREMSTHGITFGSHTANHVVLPLENVSVIKTEIAESKRELERRIEQPVVTFAYPNGEYDPTVKAAAADSGYTIAVTTENRVNRTGADLLTLGRTSLCEESTRGIAGRYSPRVAALRLGV